MSNARFLVLEGNRIDARSRIRMVTGTTPGEEYVKVLLALAPGALVELCTPADIDSELPAPLSSFSGVAITGSSLNIWRREPESLRQIELVRACFAAGVPMFGSCWGLQLGAVAAGGEVAPNSRGDEVGFARRIALTEAGRAHPLHIGRTPIFDALTAHTDEVVCLPEGSVITASNAVSAVQAAEIRYGHGTLWGVQFHPEYDLGDVVSMLRWDRQTLVNRGFFASLADLDRYTNELSTLHRDSDRGDLAWRFGLGPDILVTRERRRELANWIEHAVGLPLG